MKQITAKGTLKKLRETFALFGLPKSLVSGNGPQLVSKKLEEFLAENGIRHVTSPPFNLASNGVAENTVKTFNRQRLSIRQIKDWVPEVIQQRLRRVTYLYKILGSTQVWKRHANQIISYVKTPVEEVIGNGRRKSNVNSNISVGSIEYNQKVQVEQVLRVPNSNKRMEGISNNSNLIVRRSNRATKQPDRLTY
ncbi:hypothetical protein ILUMI_13755 [Ignelater luminosus]|uniref:Integrase catalytic domain-containing protein n=1 Tax=Ignelater luminosus TaxID=2038154 RepID=A0A8K0CXW2_IGNLU|nr:hypothetical protein ILUMI_13755 [Ignelater luminosus]